MRAMGDGKSARGFNTSPNPTFLSVDPCYTRRILLGGCRPARRCLLKFVRGRPQNKFSCFDKNKSTWQF